MLSPNINPDLCYIIGVVLGDGSLSKNNRIRLGVTNKEFALSFHDCLRKLNFKPSIWLQKRQKENWSDVWRVGVSNEKLFVFLKDLTIKKIEKVMNNKENSIQFLKGFYESEGVLLSNRNHIHITNTNLEIMKLVFGLLKKFNLRAKLYGPYGPYRSQKISYYRISLHFKNDVERFLELIKPCIKNKNILINLSN